MGFIPVVHFAVVGKMSFGRIITIFVSLRPVCDGLRTLTQNRNYFACLTADSLFDEIQACMRTGRR